MDFETKAQQACYEKVAGYMRELFAAAMQQREEMPIFLVFQGSTWAQIVIGAWGENDAVILTRAHVVSGAELTLDLLRYLLDENPKLRFGAFGVDSDGVITLDHHLLGSTCGKEELGASVAAVLATADRYDDVIVGRWGGQRALDRMR